MYTRPTRLALACAGIFTSIAASYAYAVTEELNPVVVSGARFEQPLSEVLPSVTVITKEQIQKSQARSVYEIIQAEPGVEVGPYGGLGAATSIFMRGETSANLAIYVDGIKVQTDSLATINSTGIPPLQSIERIEILRGNAGALYGESAIGGVINIYTNASSNQAPKSFASITHGSYNTTDSTAGISGRIDDMKFNLTANDVFSAGFPAINATQNASNYLPNTGDYKGHSLNLGVSQMINSDLELGVKERYQDNTYNYSQYGVGTYGRTIANDATVFAKLKINNQWLSQVDVTNSRLNYDYSPDGQCISPYGCTVSPNSVSNTNALNWTNTYELDRFNKLSFGGNYSNQRIDDGQGDLMYRDAYGVYFGDSIKWEQFDFQLNGRHDGIKVHQPDTNSQTASLINDKNFHATTGLFGVGYHLTNELRLTGSVSSGFRAPSVGEFFNLYGGPYSGGYFNPNLKPESHHTQEVGFEYKNAYSLTRVNYFHSVTNNAIDYTGYVPGYLGQYQYINIPTIKNNGVELSERLTWDSYRLIASYTHQNPVDETGYVVSRRAKNFGSVDLSKSLGAYDVGSKVIFSGSRPDGTQTLSSYQIWSFYAGYKYSDEITLRVRLDNAFNEKYQLAYGYNTPGRTAWLTLMYQQK